MDDEEFAEYAREFGFGEGNHDYLADDFELSPPAQFEHEQGNWTDEIGHYMRLFTLISCYLTVMHLENSSPSPPERVKNQYMTGNYQPRAVRGYNNYEEIEDYEDDDAATAYQPLMSHRSQPFRATTQFASQPAPRQFHSTQQRSGMYIALAL